MQSLRLPLVDMGSLKGRSTEVVDVMNRRKIDIVGLQEVRCKNHNTRIIKKNEETRKLFCSGSR